MIRDGQHASERISIFANYGEEFSFYGQKLESRKLMQR
jgi:hypothetical protein